MDTTKPNKKTSIPDKERNKQNTITSIVKTHKQVALPTAERGQSSGNTTISHHRHESDSIECFALVWLDANIDESNKYYHDSLVQLRSIVTTVYTHNDMNSCIDFFRDTKHKTVFMIMSGSLSQVIMPRIHSMSRLAAVYIFCQNKSKYERWRVEWMKVRGVYTDLTPLCEAVRRDVRYSDRNFIQISFVPKCDIRNSNLRELDPSFMYTKLLKEILLKLKYNEQSHKNFVEYCRKTKNESLPMIDQFESNYNANMVIQWYTNESFIYKMLNKSLREQVVNDIIHLGFFIRDLHQQIQQLYDQQPSEYKKQLEVYRGQLISKEDLEKIQKNALIGFNNFLSASRSEAVARKFAFNGSVDTDMARVLFIISINPSKLSTFFASIEKYSNFPEEEEILFTMHAVFQISKIILDEKDKLWTIALTLTNDDDPQLAALTERLRIETQGTNVRYRLGALLIKLGEFEQAEEIFKALDRDGSNAAEQALLNYHLGCIKYNQKDYESAINFYKTTLKLHNNKHCVNEHNLASIYNNMGLVYDSKGDYCEAIQFYEKALNIYQGIKLENSSVLATCFNNIGTAYYQMGNYLEASSNFEKAFDIAKETLPDNHPHLADCCNNIAMVYEKLKQYSEALSYYERAIQITHRALGPNHPKCGVYKRNLESLKKKNCK